LGAGGWLAWALVGAGPHSDPLPEGEGAERSVPRLDYLPRGEETRGTGSRLGHVLEGRRTERSGPRPEDKGTGPYPAAGGWLGAWSLALALLLAACLLYPVFATAGRLGDRFDKSVGPTLDGMAYMDKAVYQDQNQSIVLAWDRQAIEWLQDNVVGSPVILEATTPLYRWGSRVSIYTGLPTVIGWDWHEKQQRAAAPADMVDRRLNDVKAIYNDPDPQAAYAKLLRYNVGLIYVGALERAYYDAAGLSKFERYQGTYWDLVYQNAQVKIYRVRPPGQ